MGVSMSLAFVAALVALWLRLRSYLLFSLAALASRLQGEK
jgi:hypothetical protein